MATSTTHSQKKLKRHKDKIDTEPQPVPKKIKNEDIKREEPKIQNNIAATSHSATLGWETEDLNTLINNLAKCLPKNDVAKFSTLVEKLDWEKVRFAGYSAQECKDKWFQVMSRLRRYRTLTDMVADSRVWLKAPWQTYNNAKKIKHPDLPKKPLTPFFRYFMEKREKMGKSNPGSSVTDLAKMLSSKFASLSDKKKQKYKESYDKEYENYKLKLEQFKVDHPEVEFGSMNKQQSSHGHAQEGPPRPRTPAQLFMEEKLKKGPTNADGKKEAIEKIKKLWHDLSEGKRIKWIRRALQDEQRYEAEVIEYIKEHPNFENTKIKSVLTKAEKELKDKFDGKPERPPNSGYSLFSKILLKELKDIPSKEKMVVIAKRWRELSDVERNGYNREAQKSMSKYVEKFESYINQLPEAERTKILSENKLKLPSEKKIKQTQNLPKVDVLQTQIVAVDDPREKENTAYIFFQTERLKVIQEKYPNKAMHDAMKMCLQEWNEKLAEKKKLKYYKMAEGCSLTLPGNKSNLSNSNKPVNTKEKRAPITPNTFSKREPKRPPKSGYALYTSEQLSSLTNFEPKKRMTEIARLWNTEVSKDKKESYDSKVKELAQSYQKELNQFMATLSAVELQQYQQFNSERNRPKGKGKRSSKAETDPVVDDSNVIATIDVATTGEVAKINSSEESGSDSESHSENEEQEQPDSSGSGAESESESEEEEEEGDGEGEEEASESESNSSYE